MWTSTPCASRPQRAQCPGAGPQAEPPGAADLARPTRRVPGISAGTQLRFEGMVAVRDGLPTIYNPRYEIIGKQES